jgi:hypothetical protein
MDMYLLEYETISELTGLPCQRQQPGSLPIELMLPTLIRLPFHQGAVRQASVQTWPRP